MFKSVLALCWCGCRVCVEAMLRTIVIIRSPLKVVFQRCNSTPARGERVLISRIVITGECVEMMMIQ